MHCTLLVVEDPLISKLVRKILQRKGHTVILAGAREAARMLHSPEADIGILLTNQPARFMEFAGHVPLLYLSSAPDSSIASAFRSCRVLRKPFHPKELIDAVDRLTPGEGPAENRQA